jgi:superfamily I DNA/RNA helicase
MDIQESDKAGDQAIDPKEVAWLITAHSSKGLEFDHPRIAGLQTEAFPSDKSSLKKNDA